MRTFLAAALLALALPNAALAEDEQKDDSSSESSSASGMLRQSGALFDASPQERPQMLSFFLMVPYAYGYGVGGAARYAIPVVPNGFIPMLNDSFEIEFGAEMWAGWWNVYYTTYSYVSLAAPVGEARWTFHVFDKFDAYGKVGLGWMFPIGRTGYPGYNMPGVGFYWNTALGVLYRFGDRMYVRGELGYQGLRGGLGIEF